jgi:putative ABC transport system permease protein
MWIFVGLTVAIVAFAVISAVRQPVLFRLSVRNIPRRLGRTALIVVGLMLATTIISAAFGTGDTIRKTIRTEVLTSLGNADEVISAQEESDVEVTGEAADISYFDQSYFDEVREVLIDNPNVDGIMPAIWEATGVQSTTTRQTEPRVTIFAPDPAYMDGFGTIHDVDGGSVTIDDLSPTEVYLNEEAAENLDASPGHELVIHGPAGAQPATVTAVIRYDGMGTGSNDPGLIMPLARAQGLFLKEGQIRHIIISNRGNAESGAALTDEVIADVDFTLKRLGISIEPTKRDDLDEADAAGDQFATFFVTFGSFSIAAGIMLIFLIFVMLAAERKPEMGISRAIGTERRHLVEMFAFEGLAYDMVAAAIGALLGLAVAWAMMSIIAGVIADLGVQMRRGVSLRSLVTAYSMGVVLTFIVVTISAWRVSVLNIVTAIRNLPDPQKKTGRASLVWGIVFLLFGALLTWAGIADKTAVVFYLGVSLVIISTVPFLRWLHVGDRLAFSVPGAVLIVWWLLPWDTFDWALPAMKSDFNLFIASGLFLVTGTTWVVMYNSDVLLSFVMRVLGHLRGLAPVIRTAIAYPLTSRFRTGTTLAMFTLVVFTLVIGAITTSSFTEAYDNTAIYSGGYDIRAETVRVNPVTDLRAAIEQAPDLDAASFKVIAGQSLVNAEARQTDTDNGFAAYPVRGVSPEFLQTTTYELSARGNGYASDADVWQAINDHRSLAVLDTLPVPTRENFDFGGAPVDFNIEGFYLEDAHFEPFTVRVREPSTGNETNLTVIGILQDIVPAYMIGLTTSQATVQSSFPQQAAPVGHLIKLTPGTNVEDTADALEATFLQNGMEAVVLKEELHDVVALNKAFNYIVQGFLGLGLIVGVAALGVISARAVVERRQEIGVMRAIGFESGSVQLSFLIEASMTALAGIIFGTALGIALSMNIIRDAQAQPSWDHIRLVVPWVNLAIIYAIVLGASLLTAYLPARQASRVYPAEALRYE